MELGTTYYKLWTPDYDAVAAVYRIHYSPDALVVERYDPAARAWTEGPAEFLRHVNEGDDGADEISSDEATELIRRGLPKLPEPIPAGAL